MTDEINEEQMLDKMSELNNQLINMQRELVKKNVELKVLNDKLQHLSETDQLTGLYNRRHFFNKIKEEISRAERGNYKLALLSIDLNDFKKINDNFGHDEGDRVLREFAKTVQMHLRWNIDSVYRFGGDEFIILLIDANMSYAEKVAERLNEKVKSIHEILSLSYGIVEIVNYENIDVGNLLEIADGKMFEYKREFKRSQA